MNIESRNLIERLTPGSRPGSEGASARPITKWLIAASLAFVLLAATLGLLFHHNADSATQRAEAAKEAEAAGAQTIGQLFSYNYRTIDEALPDRLPLLTDSFASSYRTMVLSQVKPAAKRQRLTTRTDVVTSSVVSVNDDSVRLLMFLNQTSARSNSPVPVLAGSRVEVTMQKVGGAWRVASVDPV